MSTPHAAPVSCEAGAVYSTRKEQVMSEQLPKPGEYGRFRSTVFVLNGNATNRWSATVQPGKDDDGNRIDDHQCEKIAGRIDACLRACEGIDDPQHLRAQRDELLESLKGV